jgi:hypothetical protein
MGYDIAGTTSTGMENLISALVSNDGLLKKLHNLGVSIIPYGNKIDVALVDFAGSPEKYPNDGFYDISNLARFDSLTDEVELYEPDGSTDIYEALEKAKGIFDNYPPEVDFDKIIILLSDGEPMNASCMTRDCIENSIASPIRYNGIELYTIYYQTEGFDEDAVENMCFWSSDTDCSSPSYGQNYAFNGGNVVSLYTKVYNQIVSKASNVQIDGISIVDPNLTNLVSNIVNVDVTSALSCDAASRDENLVFTFDGAGGLIVKNININYCP